MEKLLKNPLVIGGALIGAYYILKKKPETKVGRTIGSVRNLAQDVVDTTLTAATDTIDEMVLHNLENKIELSAKTLGEQVQKWL